MAQTFYVSRHHTAAEYANALDTDSKIEIFRDRVQGWQLDQAAEIERQINLDGDQERPMKHAGYCLISILFSYFEMIAPILDGLSTYRRSKVAFCLGFENVYPRLLTEPQREIVYERIRCGMYHNAYTKRGTVISGSYKKVFEMDAAGNVLVNPHMLVPTIQQHFNKLIVKLRDPAETTIRSNFATHFLAE